MIEYAYIDNLQIHPTASLGLTGFDIGSPAPRAVSDLRPSAHGATDSTLWYGPRLINVTGRVRGASFEDMWAALDAVKGALVLGSTHTLRFRRSGLSYDEQVEVRVDSPVDMPLGISRSPLVNYGVTLFAADPRLYSATLNSGAYDPSDSSTGGLVFPLSFPLEFDVSGSGQLAVTNEGNINSPVVITIIGPVINPIIDNDTTGESIYTEGLDLSAGSTLTIDVKRRSVVLDGTSRPDLIDSQLTDWFYIAPGQNLLRLRGSGMVAAQTELAVEFRNARI